MIFQQTARPLTFTTPLGPDVLMPTSVVGREAVSELFSYRIDLLSENQAVTPDMLVARPVTIGMRMADGRMRRIHGRISRGSVGWTTREGLRQYQVEVTPWLAALQHVIDCRVFQNMTVPAIAEQIFGRFGYTDFDTSLLTEKYIEREYSVQFQESCYDYLCRLFEEEGIFFFFRHEENRHVLVLADTNAAFTDGLETDLPYEPDRDDPGVIKSWFHRYVFLPFRLAASDYNPDAPTAALEFSRPTLMQQLVGADFSAYERFDWPGGYDSHDEGDIVLRRRLEELEGNFHRIDGTSSCAGFAAGTRIRLAEHPDRQEKGRPFFLLSVEHRASDDSLLVRGDGKGYEYANSFTACSVRPRGGEVDKQYRPARKTPRPSINGTQTAVVVGPAGETIHCDESGRVKVQFHWDRHGGHDDTSSCWVRVSQAWAGSRFGAMHVPHVGQEVLVNFLDGDPDRPVIVGRVYNADRKNAMVTGAVSRKTQTLIQDQGGNTILTEGKDKAQRIQLQSPTGTTQMEIGLLTASNPAATMMARFASAFPTAPVASCATSTSSTSSDEGVSLTTQSTLWTKSTETYIHTTADAYSITDGDQYYTVTRTLAGSIGGDVLITTYGTNSQTIHGDMWTKVLSNTNTEVEGDVTGLILGNEQSAVAGNSADLVMGSTESLFLGFAAEMTVGFSFSVALGGSLEIEALKTARVYEVEFKYAGLSSSFKLVRTDIEEVSTDMSAADQNISMSNLDANLSDVKATGSSLETSGTKMGANATELESAGISFFGGFKFMA